MAQKATAASTGGFWSRAKVPGAAQPNGQNSLDYLTVKVIALAEVFSGDIRYRLNCYQRAYSWQAPQVMRLLHNIREAMAKPDGRYCLGRLMLAIPANNSNAELVDGHQRLITLTILFAVLRDLEIDETRRTQLHGLIADGYVKGSTTLPQYRMTAQITPSRFFEAHVLRPGSTEDAFVDSLEELSDTERNIYDNRELIRAEMTSPGMDDETRRALADFVTEACHVIMMSVADQQEAWLLVHVEEETRLSYSQADQAKAILLTAMPAADRIKCSRMWEGCEAVLSADDMHRLLVHIGAMKWRRRVQSNTPIEDEIIQNFGIESGGFAFMDQEYVPNAERLGALRRQSVGAVGRHRQDIARSIEYMSWIDTQLWVPAALKWLSARGDTDPETELFFRRLERLVWIMKIAGEDPGVQETRIFDLCGEIGNWLKVGAMSKLQIEERLLNPAHTNLRSPNFDAKHYSDLVLRRLSILLGADPGPIERDKVTVEHVLPRNPPAPSEWRRMFRTDGDIKEHAQRLGNLNLLTGAQNQQAGTQDWNAKRAILANSGFKMAQHAATETEWNAKIIKRRSEQLIDMLMKNWQLTS